MYIVTVAATSSISGTTLSIAAILVTLLAGFGGPLVVHLVRSRRHKLFYGLPADTSVLTTPHGISDLELRRHGKVLAQPHVLEVQLISRGRKDIPSNAFDKGNPIRFDVGANIVELLEVTSEPKFIKSPKVTIVGTALNIGPNLIGKRQKIAVTLLADGKPSLTCQSPIKDVDVLEQKAGQPPPEASLGYDKGVIAGLVAAAGALLILALIAPSNGTATEAYTTAITTMLGSAVLISVYYWIVRRGQRQRRLSRMQSTVSAAKERREIS